MTSKVDAKSSELVARLHSLSEWNLARVKFFVLLICALCKVQTVGFDKLSTAFNSAAVAASSLRRIERFMAKYQMNTDVTACLIFSLLPHKPPFV